MDEEPMRQMEERRSQTTGNSPAVVEAVVPPAPPASPWYKDPPKLVGVLGFALALATLGERTLVRSSELTAQRLQELRNVMGDLADIQSDYLEALAANPQNIYQLGTAKNTKRQMLLQTADALLDYPSVKRQASAQIFGALASEALSDGRYDLAKTYFENALLAPGASPWVKPFLLRSLGILYRVPNTPVTDTTKAADYFAQARSLLDARSDDAAHLSWAETVLTEGNLEVMYGNVERAKELADQAQTRIEKVRSLSPQKTQLLRWSTALGRGEQFAQTQDAALAQPVSPGVTDSASAPATTRQSGPIASSVAGTASGARVSFELWAPVPGQLSGAEMTIHVDGKEVGQLSNLGKTRRLDVTGVSPGAHKLELLISKVYFIDPVNGPSATGGGFRCDALFEAKTAATPLKINVATGFNGLLCGAQ